MAWYTKNNVFVQQGSSLPSFGTRVLSSELLIVENKLYDRKTLKEIQFHADIINSNYRLTIPSWDGFVPWCSYNNELFVNNTGGRFGGNTGNNYTQIDETNHWLENDVKFENYWYNEDDKRFVYMGGAGIPAVSGDVPDTLVDYFNKDELTIEHSKSSYSNSYGSVMYPIADIGESVIFVPVPGTANNKWYGYPAKYNKSSTYVKNMKTNFNSYHTWLVSVDHTTSEAIYLVRSQNTMDTSIYKWNFKTDNYLSSVDHTSSSIECSFAHPQYLSITYSDGTIYNNYSIVHNHDKHQPSNVAYDYNTGYYYYYQFVVWHWSNDYQIVPYKVSYDKGATNEVPVLISVQEVILNEPNDSRDLYNNNMYDEYVYRNGSIPRIIDNGNKLQVIYYGYNDKNSCVKTYTIAGDELTFVSISYLKGHHLFSGQNNSQYKGHLQSVKFINNVNYDEFIANYSCDIKDWTQFSNDVNYINQGSHICMLYKRNENFEWYEAWSNFRPYNASIIDKDNNRTIGMCKNHVSEYVNNAKSYNHAKYYIDSYTDKKVKMLYKFNESDLIYDGVDKDITIYVASHFDRTRISKSFKLKITNDTKTKTIFKDTNTNELIIKTNSQYYISVIITLKDAKNFEICEYII